jgi:hypothetical protein
VNKVYLGIKCNKRLRDKIEKKLKEKWRGKKKDQR